VSWLTGLAVRQITCAVSTAISPMGQRRPERCDLPANRDPHTSTDPDTSTDGDKSSEVHRSCHWL